MKTFHLIAIFFYSALFYCCNSNNEDSNKAQSSGNITDTSHPRIQSTQLSGIPDYSTTRPFSPDTKDLQHKREKILDRFYVDNSPAGKNYDTLVDINYDGFRDYIIGYYGLAGTGYKYRIMAYLFSKAKNNYFADEQISNLVNPSFFLSKFKITGFYIALGGGSGKKLEWINQKWTTTREFEVDNQGDSTIWQIYYPLQKKKEKIMKPFQVTPPEDVLEWNNYF